MAYGIAAVLRRALSLKYFEQYPDVKNLLGLSVGAVKAFIMLVTLAIAFAVLKLGPPWSTCMKLPTTCHP